MPFPPPLLHSDQAFIIYTRVSTVPQEVDGDDARQFDRLRVYSEEWRLRVVQNFGDTGSAHKIKSLNALPDLKAALSSARSDGSIILVTAVSRISRSLSFYLRHIKPFGVRFFSWEHGRVLSDAEMEEEVRKAEAWAKICGAETKRALKTAGKKKPLTPDAARAMGRMSAKSRGEVAEENTIIAVSIIRELGFVPTARRLAEDFNRRGRLTITQEPWTADRIRRVLQAAKRQIELDDEEDDFSAGGNLDDLADAERIDAGFAEDPDAVAKCGAAEVTDPLCSEEVAADAEDLASDGLDVGVSVADELFSDVSRADRSGKVFSDADESAGCDDPPSSRRTGPIAPECSSGRFPRREGHDAAQLDGPLIGQTDGARHRSLSGPLTRVMAQSEAHAYRAIVRQIGLGWPAGLALPWAIRPRAPGRSRGPVARLGGSLERLSRVVGARGRLAATAPLAAPSGEACLAMNRAGRYRNPRVPAGG